MQKGGYVYIVTNKNNSVFYIGVTNNLDRRIYEHKKGMVAGFSKKYNIHSLVYFEQYPTIEGAILREKQLKNWHRSWKLNLIKKSNPRLVDLYKDAETSSA